jgi:DNA-binding NtrC family response regulator
MRRCVLVETGPRIGAAALALPAAETEVSRRTRMAVPASAPASEPPSGMPTLPTQPTTSADVAERAAIEEALGRARGVVSRAAAEMGLSRQALYRRMERLGLSLERRVR